MTSRAVIAIVGAMAIGACAAPRAERPGPMPSPRPEPRPMPSTEAEKTPTVKLEAMRGPFVSLADACDAFAVELACEKPCRCVPLLATLVLGGASSSSLVGAATLETRGRSPDDESVGALRIGGAWFYAARRLRVVDGSAERRRTRVIGAIPIPSLGATRWAQIDLEQDVEHGGAPCSVERTSLVCARRDDRAACVTLALPVAHASEPPRAPTTAAIEPGGALVVPAPFDAPKPGKYVVSWPSP